MSNSQRTYPIALSHGIARFDVLTESFKKGTRRLLGGAYDSLLVFFARRGYGLDRLHYFRGIRSLLRERGFDAHHTNVSFARSLEERGGDLKREIESLLGNTGAKKVHVIAHSMGGLDARFMIARLGMSKFVASLTTIGTPHLGTSLADYNLERGGRDLIARLDKLVDLRGFINLTRDACGSFNESVRNFEAVNGVLYQTYSSWQERENVLTLLQPAWDVIEGFEGQNDGLVSATSQSWTAEIEGDGGIVKKVVQKEFPVRADHLNEVGWWDLNETKDVGLLRGLGARKDYEAAIRNVYLDIAEDLKSRFPI